MWKAETINTPWNPIDNMEESRSPSPYDERVKLQRAQRAWIANKDGQRTSSGDLGVATVAAAKPAQLDSPRCNEITRECSTHWVEPSPVDPTPVGRALQTLSRLDIAQLKQVIRHLHATLESGQDDANDGMHGELHSLVSEAQGMLEQLPAEVVL